MPGERSQRSSHTLTRGIMSKLGQEATHTQHAHNSAARISRRSGERSSHDFLPRTNRGQKEIPYHKNQFKECTHEVSSVDGSFAEVSAGKCGFAKVCVAKLIFH
jgi:hypothetical protein